MPGCLPQEKGSDVSDTKVQAHGGPHADAPGRHCAAPLCGSEGCRLEWYRTWPRSRRRILVLNPDFSNGFLGLFVLAAYVLLFIY